MDAVAHDPHFLRHVSTLAGKREVVAHTAIFSRSGIKLIDSGRTVTAAIYDHLVAHKLLPPLEECLTVADAVTPAELMDAVAALFAEDRAIAALLPAGAAREEAVRVFGTLPLSPPLAFKLTVAREERPDIYRHSLRVACCAAALAQHVHAAHREVADAAAAGLFHDIGLLHVDPQLLESGRPLAERERQHLYSHPLTAYLMLERDPIWHPVVSTAVLEHHERLDGSGYPKGLDGERLSPLGQLLAVAELAATLLATADTQAAWLRLGVVLRMNEGKLSHELTNALLAMFPHTAAKAAEHLLGRVLETLVEVAIVFLRWQALRGGLAEAAVASFVDKRMDRLAHNLAAAGIDLEYWSAIDAEIEYDPAALREMEAAAQEGLWQLRAIAQEVRRRWPQLAPADGTAAQAVAEWLEGIEAVGR